MRKRIVSVFLALVLLLGMFPVTAMADSVAPWEPGDTYVSENRNASLPDVDATYEWSGPVWQYNCDKEAHTHNEDWREDSWCYSYKFAKDGCGGQTSFSHWWHDEDCYEHDCGRNHNHDRDCRVTVLTCTKEVHVHDENELRYVWTLVEAGSELQYRNWWPVFWDFDSRSDVKTSGLVTVTANDTAVQYSGGEVLSRTALSAQTANTGDVLTGGFQITVQPGYYVSRYRLVCGNHTDCGITGYSEGITTENTMGNYTASVNYQPDGDDFDHWYNIGGMHNNQNSSRGVYQPITKPDASANNIYHTTGSNTIYPFYLLIEVERDTASYDITYSWGTLAEELSADVPGRGEYNNLPRNTEHTVLEAGAGAVEAANLGYELLGWEVVSDSYEDGIVVKPGNVVTITGDDIELVAKWAPAVTWRYTGSVPAGATVLPETTNYPQDEQVPVVQVTAPEGYKFDGWREVTNNRIDLTGSSFTMPDAPVVIEGSFSEDLGRTKRIGYTVEYYFNGVRDSRYDEQVFETVWVNAPDTLTFDTDLIKDFENWTYVGSNPANLSQPIVNGAEIHLYYNGTHESLELSKAVYDASGIKLDDENMTALQPVKVGDVLTYKITVKNIGNTELTDVVLEDSPNGAGESITMIAPASGVTHSTKADAGYDLVDVFTIASIPVGGSVVIEYTYTVVADDAGNKLINSAFWNDEDEGDTSTTEVPVTDRYTLTVEHYADDTLQTSLTETFTMHEDSDWTVEVGDTAVSNTYNAPEAITVGGVSYAFDAPATTDALSGTLTEDTTVKLYYAKDEIGTIDSEEPDGTPDKYQVTFLYTTTPGGALADGALTKEVVNVYDVDAFLQGETVPARRGVATASGTTALATNGDYRFANQWTLARQGHTAFVTARTDLTLGSYQMPPAGSETTAEQQVIGGNTYIFTAVFEDIPAPALSVDKLVGFEETDIVPVGTKVEYIIHVENTGNVPLTEVLINDFMSYVDGTEHSTIENYRDYIQELRVTGTEDDNFVLENDLSSVVIRELAVGQIISVEYVYVVQEADAGKKLHNIAYVATTYEGEDYEVQDEEVITIEEQTVELSVEKELASVNNKTGSEVPDFVTVGDDLVWDIVVTNTGTADGWIDLPVDTLNGTTNLTVVADSSVETRVEDQVTEYKVPAKGTAKFTASYTVENKEYPDNLVNKVTVANVEDTDDPVMVKALDVTKTVDKTSASVGDTITWTITVRNLGETLTDVRLADTLYAEGVDIGELELMKDDTVVTKLDFLAKGASVVLTASYKVTLADAGKTLINYVVAEVPGEGLTDETTSPETEVRRNRWPIIIPGRPVLNKKDHEAYIIGYEDDTVRPEDNITRAEVATIFFRLLSEDSRAYYWSQSNEYSDVQSSDWFNNAISTLSKAGIITGYPDDTFRPNAPITRAEFATIAARFSEVVYNGGNSFIDVPESHWAARFIALAEYLGWIDGYPDGTFKPNRNITRAEAMTLINRVLERAVEKEHMLPNMVTWVDNRPGSWYYEAVQEATNSHEYTRLNKRVANQNFNYEDWYSIEEIPNWTALEKSWSTAYAN